MLFMMIVMFVLSLSCSAATAQASVAQKQKGRGSDPGTSETGAVKTGLTGAGKSAKIKVWHFKQDSQMLGKRELFIASDALRIDDLTTKTITVSSAPDWTVSVYSPSLKLFSSVKLAQFEDPPMKRAFLPFTYDMVNRSWRKTKEIRKDGLTLRTLSIQTDRNPLHSNLAFKFGKGARINRAEYAEVSNLALPVQMLTILNRMYLGPRIFGVPVGLRLDWGTDAQKLGLETSLIEQVVVTRDHFSPPAHLKETKNINSLWSGQRDDQLLESISDFIMPEAEKGDNKNKPSAR